MLPGVCHPTDRTVPPRQPILTRALGGLLLQAEDPDATFIRDVGGLGCDLGVLEPMPRTPLVYREKKMWRLEDWPFPLEPASDN